MFNKFMSKLEGILTPIATWMSNNPFLRGMTRGTMGTLSLSLIAGIAIIIAKPPIPLENGEPIMFAAWYYWGLEQTWIMQLNEVFTGLIGLSFLLGMIASLCEHFKLSVVTTLPLGIGSYFLAVAAPTIFMLEDGKKVSATVFANFGASGIFPAIILAILTVLIVKFFHERNVGFKFPSSVPPYVKQSFDSLIPAIVLTFVTLLINYVCINVFHSNMSSLITTFMSPLLKSFENVIVVALFMMLINLFWYLGVHGGSIVNPIFIPIATMYMVENVTNYAQGLPVTHFFTTGIRFSLILMGGAGIFGLALLNATSKSKTLREVSKVALIPAIFNISEPTIFGTPVMYNTQLFLPFLAIPIVNTLIAWFSIDVLHLFTGTIVMAPGNTPVVLQAILAHASLTAGAVAIFIIFVDVLIYFPFFKRYEKVLLEQERLETEVA